MFELNTQIFVICGSLIKKAKIIDINKFTATHNTYTIEFTDGRREMRQEIEVFPNIALAKQYQKVQIELEKSETTKISEALDSAFKTSPSATIDDIINTYSPYSTSELPTSILVGTHTKVDPAKLVELSSTSTSAIKPITGLKADAYFIDDTILKDDITLKDIDSEASNMKAEDFDKTELSVQEIIDTESAIDENLKSKTWQSKDGKKVPIIEMSNGYISNCIKFLEKKFIETATTNPINKKLTLGIIVFKLVQIRRLVTDTYRDFDFKET